MILTEDIINGELQREGPEFTDRPDDRGGPTKWGVTLKTLIAFCAPQPTTVDDLKALDEDSARAVYRHAFVEVPGFSKIAHPALEALMVDAGVQHGPEEAIKIIQRALVLKADGILGDITLRAINTAETRSLYMFVCAARVRLYGSIIAHDKELAVAKSHGYALQADNALGWANRIGQFIESPL